MIELLEEIKKDLLSQVEAEYDAPEPYPGDFYTGLSRGLSIAQGIIENRMDEERLND